MSSGKRILGKRSIIGTRVSVPVTVAGQRIFVPAVISSTRVLGVETSYCVQFVLSEEVHSDIRSVVPARKEYRAEQMVGPGFQSVSQVVDQFSSGQKVFLTFKGREVSGSVVRHDRDNNSILVALHETQRLSAGKSESLLQRDDSSSSSPVIHVRRRLEDMRLLESRKSARLLDSDIDYSRILTTSSAGASATGVDHESDIPNDTNETHAHTNNNDSHQQLPHAPNVMPITQGQKRRTSDSAEDLIMDDCSAAMVLMSLSCSPKSPIFFPQQNTGGKHFDPAKYSHSWTPGSSIADSGISTFDSPMSEISRRSRINTGGSCSTGSGSNSDSSSPPTSSRGVGGKNFVDEGVSSSSSCGMIMKLESDFPATGIADGNNTDGVFTADSAAGAASGGGGAVMTNAGCDGSSSTGDPTHEPVFLLRHQQHTQQPASSAFGAGSSVDQQLAASLLVEDEGIHLVEETTLTVSSSNNISTTAGTGNITAASSLPTSSSFLSSSSLASSSSASAMGFVPTSGVMAKKKRIIFTCTWPGCEAQYQQNSAIERHVRQLHSVDAGEEEFYYTEHEISISSSNHNHNNKKNTFSPHAAVGAGSAGIGIASGGAGLSSSTPTAGNTAATANHLISMFTDHGTNSSSISSNDSCGSSNGSSPSPIPSPGHLTGHDPSSGITSVLTPGGTRFTFTGSAGSATALPTWSHLDMARPAHEDPEYQRSLAMQTQQQKQSSSQSIPITIPGFSFIHHSGATTFLPANKQQHHHQQQQNHKYMRVGDTFQRVSPGSSLLMHNHGHQSVSPKSRVGRTRGEARKCRKVYGMESRELWCTQCKWKKACTRFHD